MNPAFWADVLLIIHFTFVLGVIVPVPLIAIGALLNWRWVRNIWFRCIHLAMIGVVTLQAVVGAICPLTIWESQLRQLAGAEGYEHTFMRHWVSQLMYYDAEPWVFTVAYCLLTAMIVSLFWLAPVNWPTKRGRPKKLDLRLTP